MPNSDDIFFSVILPCFNAAVHLPRSIESINDCFDGFEKSVEIIIISDNENDANDRELSAIAEKFLASSGIASTFIGSKGNRGVNIARSRGLIKARGEWAIFLDAGDELIVKADMLVEFCRRSENASMVCLLASKSKDPLNYPPSRFESQDIDYLQFVATGKPGETLDVVNIRLLEPNWFWYPVNGFESIGWARLLKERGSLRLWSDFGRYYNQEAVGLSGRRLSARARDMFIGSAIYLAENGSVMPMRAKIFWGFRLLVYGVSCCVKAFRIRKKLA